VNPWLRSRNKKNIGEFLKQYGGGGHKDVGGVEIRGKSATLAAVADAIKFLNEK
jgi:nanoRNase/pAp phosphatase (c-di-AMP/oligoRNAs hydrolase)